jgi:hypothetical protein
LRTSRSAGLVVLACIAVSFGAGCVGSPPEIVETDSGRDTAEVLGLEQPVSGQLDCDAGVCRRWYRIEQPRAGELQIDVHARTGDDVPDFDVRLEDDRGELLWGFAPTGRSPRKLRRVLAPGSYLLLLSSVGDVRGPLAFEILARVVARESSLPDPGAIRAAPNSRSSRHGPHRPELWMHAEIVRVEGRAGLPTYVVLDAGRRDELRVGLAGELLEDETSIAAFELIEVDDRSSRARLLRPPTAAITYATRARVRVPLPER